MINRSLSLNTFQVCKTNLSHLFNYLNQIKSNGFIMKKKPIFTSLALLLAAGMPAMAVSPRALSQFVNLELVHSKTTVGTIIQSISQQTGYEFSYDVSILDKEISNVSVNVKNERIENVLDRVFQGTGISYKIVDNRIFLKERGKGYSVDYYVDIKSGGGRSTV